jgi:hypothetical protein
MQWIIKAFNRIPDTHKIYFVLGLIAAAVILVALGYGAAVLAFIMGG